MIKLASSQVNVLITSGSTEFPNGFIEAEFSVERLPGLLAGARVGYGWYRCRSGTAGGPVRVAWRGPAGDVSRCAWMSGGVFVNYRAEDAGPYGALLYVELLHRFGAELVFRDSESIPPGSDYVDQLLSRVRGCRVLLAVIGQRWLTAAGGDGRRRIDGPGDWIRPGVAGAVAPGALVLPLPTGE